MIVGFQCSQQLMEGLNQVVVAQPIIDHFALFTSTDQAQVQQMVQMLRSRGSGQPYLLSDLPASCLALITGELCPAFQSRSRAKGTLSFRIHACE